MEKKIKIQVRDLNLYYGQNHALHGVNMDIKENSVTALIGPSGCGKSTFLKCINRMNDLVDNVRIEGSIEIDGENIYAPSVDTTVLRKKVGMVFQQPNPFPMSIYDNIAYGPRVHGIKDKKILDQIVEESLQGAAIFNEVKDRLKKSMALIYIVEDDESIREIESIALKNSNYIVSAFENAKEFYKKLDELVPDLILLDVMLPDESGYDIVRKLRKRPATQDIPIIMVTAKTTEMDMIKGFDGGADDYIKKPFSIMELITRVKALLRRTAKEEPKLLKLDDLVIDHERHVVTVNNEPVDLTYKEYELLRLLMGSQGIVMTREVIMRSVWDTDFEGETRTVDMHIKTLRHKLGDYGSRIKTVRNVGYVIE